MKKRSGSRGFTLVEILLVIVIIALILAVVIPRAWRANVDSRFSLVRQAATELAAFGNQWAEQQLAAQYDDSTSSLNNYFITLSGNAPSTMEWTGSTVSNWNKQTAAASSYAVPGRNPSYPSVSVEEIVPPEKIVRNPFNGASYFFNVNAPSYPAAGQSTPGAIGAAYVTDSDGWNHFALLFHGASDNALYGGQSESSLEGLRNGVLLARTR